MTQPDSLITKGVELKDVKSTENNISDHYTITAKVDRLRIDLPLEIYPRKRTNELMKDLTVIDNIVL